MHYAQDPATVLLSGGIDSAACVHFLRQQEHHINCVFIDYGQAAARQEQLAAKRVANHFQVPLHVQTFGRKRRFSAGEIIGRNAFLITSAMLITPVHSGLLGIGIHSGTRYFDCGSRFFDLMARLIEEQTDGRVALVAPFLDWRKSEIVEYARASKIPLHLTYSCELGTQPVCGKCASCVDRRVLGVG